MSVYVLHIRWAIPCSIKLQNQALETFCDAWQCSGGIPVAQPEFVSGIELDGEFESNEPSSADIQKVMTPDAPSKVFIHDLRNMLAPMRNAAHLLRLRAAQDTGLLSIADLIDRQIKSIGAMLDVSENQTQSTSPPSSKPAAAAFKSRRLLVADDSEAVRLSISAVLKEMGHEVKGARDGEEALAMALDWAPDCVLLDVQMPKLNGIEVARRLRSKFPFGTLKLVMMSGNNLDEHTVNAAKHAGFDHCVDKIDDLGFLNQFLETGISRIA